MTATPSAHPRQPRVTRLVRAAAYAWIAGAVLYLALEAIAASGFPGYSYAHHYISDLGVPYESDEGRGFRSRLALLMNAAFVVQGVLLLLGAELMLRTGVVGPRVPLLGLSVLYAVGLLLVGTVHAGPRESADGTSVLHVAGAGAAIICGNLLAIVAAGVSHRLGARRRYRYASAALGVIGLLSLLMLMVDSGTASFTLLPDGAWERLAVYPIHAWELLTGFTVLAAYPRVGSRGEPYEGGTGG